MSDDLPGSGPVQTAGGSVLWKDVENDFYIFIPLHPLSEAMETYHEERILELGKKIL